MPKVTMRWRGGAHRLFVSARIWVGVAVGLAALYLAGRGTDLAQLTQIVARVRLPFLGLALVTSLVTLVAKGLRWRWLFYPQRPSLGVVPLTSLVAIGQAVNFLVPGRWGELVRVYLAGEEGGIGKSYTLGTVAAEKLLDVVALALLILSLLPLLAMPDWLGERVTPIVATSVSLVLAAAILLAGRRIWLRLVDRALGLLPAAGAVRWRARIVAGLDGLTALRHHRAAVVVVGLTCGVWLAAALTNLSLLLAFHLPASLLIALFLLAVLQAGVAVPSTPGKLGVFQYLCVLALAVFRVPAATAFGFSLVLYLTVVGTTCAWAALALWRRSWSLRRLAEATTAEGAGQ